MTDDTFLFPRVEERNRETGQVLKFRIKVERWERREGGEGGRMDGWIVRVEQR